MAVIQELIRQEENGRISFGNYLMDEKKKVLDFEANGDLYKVKTFREITKLEKNGKMLLEAVPGATIHNFGMDEKGAKFSVESEEDIQITLELEPEMPAAEMQPAKKSKLPLVLAGLIGVICVVAVAAIMFIPRTASPSPDLLAGTS